MSISTAVRIARRCRCTGESANAVRRRREPLAPGVLVPSAVSQPQRELEAAVLLAALRMSGHGLSTINWVGPGLDSLRLKIAHDEVASFLAAALPVVTDGEVVGIPGLRPRPGRDYVDFRLIGVDGARQAAVRLVGVSRAQYRDATTLAPRADVLLWREFRDSLHTREAELIHDLAAQPVELMSGLLRRFALLRSATMIKSVVDGDALRVQWRDGPDGTVIASILGESECRIPGAVVRSLRMPSGIHLSPGCACLGHDEPEWAWVKLEIASPPQPDDSLDTPPPALEQQPQSMSAVTSVWDRPDMRAALAARDCTQVYRLLRQDGISPRQIAAQTGQSQSEVSEILQGRQVRAHDVLARIAAGLGVPRGYVGLPVEWETWARAVPTAIREACEDAESAKRRKFLAYASLVTMGTTRISGNNPRPWASNPTQPRKPTRIGMTDVCQVEAATRALRSLDYRYGGSFCRDAVIAQLSWVQQMLGAAETDAVKQRLHAAVADLNNFARQVGTNNSSADS